MFLETRKVRRPKSLDDIYAAEDELDLLNGVTAKKESLSEADKQLQKLDGICKFIEKEKRLPSRDSTDFAEQRLAVRYHSLCYSNPDLQEACLAFREKVNGRPADENVTEPAAQTDSEPELSFSSLEDIFNRDSLGMLDIPDDFVPPVSLHKTKKVIVNKADTVAKSVPCPNFAEYAPLFDEIRVHLKSGNLKTSKFKGYAHRFEPGQIFILNGIFVLVAACDYKNVVSKNHKKAYRIRLIYSNGTEVSPLNYTFLESINIDELSARIQAVNAAGESFLKELKEYFADEQETFSKQKAGSDGSGYIYILRTLSKDPELLKFQESSYLVKIGFCTTTVEERIKNAANDATYLFAPVELITSIRCSGMDVHRFEQLIHACLYAHRLKVTLTTAEGKKFNPREWFTVSADTAIDVAMHIKDGTINQYKIDPVTGKLKLKDKKA